MTGPRFSIVTPVFNTNRRHLEQCISSVLVQSFQDWELLLIDDMSSARHVRRVLERAAALDSRIKLHFRLENGGIVSASNDALSMATGEFVVLLDHDDVLEPDALELVEEKLRSDDDIDYVYSDETMMTVGGQVNDRFYKPDWSPERFRSQMYVCHLSAIRRSLMCELGGFRPGFDGSQDYDLIFRVTERARKIAHVRHLLYHWRMAKTSVANNPAAKPYAYEAGQRAIESSVARAGHTGRVSRVLEVPGNYKVSDRFTMTPTVELVIPSQDRSSIVWGQLRSHNAATREDLLRDPGMDLWFRPIKVGSTLAANFNAASRESNADIIIFVSPALKPITAGWATELIQPLGDPEIGAVCGVTYTANSRLEHAGYFLDGSFLRKAYFRLGMKDLGQRAVLNTTFEVSAADWQCLAVKRSVFETLNGFDESLDHPWVVVDFCLRAAQMKQSTVVNPWAKFFEFSNNDDLANPRIRAPKSFREQWSDVFESDPYRPERPRAQSVESLRPFWRPMSLRAAERVRKGLQ